MNRHLLVTLADKNYLAQAKQLFSSVYHNSGWQGDYMLLAHGLSDKDLRWFRKKGILIYKCKPIRKETYGLLSPTMLSKFYLFTPYFKKWKNIVYLDADIIVRASLDSLTKIKGFAAAPDLPHHQLKDNLLPEYRNKTKILPILKEVNKKYNLNARAFNAGVFAFSTEIVRDNDLDKLKNLTTKCERIVICGDQLIINLFFYKKWQKLPFIFNIYSGYAKNDYGLEPNKIKGAVFHFCGQDYRPWFKSNQFYSEWETNLKKAELINLKNRPKAKETWSEREIKDYESKMRKIRILRGIRNEIERYIGLVGIGLKKRSPKLYHLLKSPQ